MHSLKRRRLTRSLEPRDAGTGAPMALVYARDIQTAADRRRLLVQAAKGEFFPRHLALLREKECQLKEWRVDKAFAAVWLSDGELLVGTKCNKLLRLDPETGTARSVALPEVAARTRAVSAGMSCGIHCIAINPSRTMLATGGTDPADCAVLSLPNFRHVQTLQAHDDWVFGAAWLTDRHLVTGSRDKAVMLWQVDPEKGLVNGTPREARKVHRGKVRDVKYSPELRRLATISKDGNLRIWDPELNGVRALNVGCPEAVDAEADGDVICMAVQENVLAVGSGVQVSLVDVRGKRHIRNIKLPRGDRGVRSLIFQDDVLSLGSGLGWLSFISLRCMDFLPLNRGDLPEDREAWKLHHVVGTGWVDEYDSRDLYDEMMATTAVYAHCWDPCSARLFACGGPLAYGLGGCYMGLWR